MQNHEVIDNYLDQEYFYFLKKVIFSSNFDWYLGYEGEVKKGDQHFQGKLMHHNFYLLHRPRGYLSINPDFLNPILSKLNPKALIRIKANLYFKTNNVEDFRMHKDYDFPHKGAILSLNTNNGYTILNDGTKIESVENRMILFDSSINHAGSSCSDADARINININYF